MQSPCQIVVKNAIKYWKDFFLYFTTLETYCVPKRMGKKDHRGKLKLAQLMFFL